jgi:hypothetical protein
MRPNSSGAPITRGLGTLRQVRDEHIGVAMAKQIKFALGNFTLTFFVPGLVAAGIAIARKPDGFYARQRR